MGGKSEGKTFRSKVTSHTHGGFTGPGRRHGTETGRRGDGPTRRGRGDGQVTVKYPTPKVPRFLGISLLIRSDEQNINSLVSNSLISGVSSSHRSPKQGIHRAPLVCGPFGAFGRDDRDGRDTDGRELEETYTSSP